MTSLQVDFKKFIEELHDIYDLYSINDDLEAEDGQQSDSKKAGSGFFSRLFDRSPNNDTGARDRDEDADDDDDVFLSF